jgi:hypothetical protein
LFELLKKTVALLGWILDAAGGVSNTIVVYTADPGGPHGDYGLPFKGPFPCELLIRIPVPTRAPGRMNAGERADIAPTRAALASVKWPWRDAVFLEYYAKQKWVNPIRTVRTRRWKLNMYERGNRELYDLQTDPGAGGRYDAGSLSGNAGCGLYPRDCKNSLASGAFSSST